MTTLERARARLREQGTLLLTPELVTLVAGEPVRGSWWSHPKGRAIFTVATKLEADPDVLTAKLVGGKVTFLAARLWPALFRVVTDRAWRVARSADLAPDAKALLTRVERAKRVSAADPKPRKSL